MTATLTLVDKILAATKKNKGGHTRTLSGKEEASLNEIHQSIDLSEARFAFTEDDAKLIRRTVTEYTTKRLAMPPLMAFEHAKAEILPGKGPGRSIPVAKY